MINLNHIKDLTINGQLVTQLQVGSNIIWKKEQPTPPTPSSYDYQVYDTKEEFDTSLNIPYAYAYNESKWYALNSNKQYEEYGIYEITDDINSITKYPNKLAVVGTIEYQYQNNRWVEVGTYESSFGEIGTLSRESFPSGSQFPLNFVLKKTDVSDWFQLSIYGDSGDVRIQRMGSDWDYRVSMSRGTVTEDDEYYYFNKPEDYESDSVEVMDVMYWDEPITMYGGSTVASVKYDKIIYPYNNGYYYQSEDITPKGMNVMYNINGDIVTYNGNEYIHTDENPYFEFITASEDVTSGVFDLYNFEVIYNENWVRLNSNEIELGKHYYTILTDRTISAKSAYGGNKFDYIFNLPNNLTSIGKDAFHSCSSLTSVTIPDSVTSIGNYAFYGCSKLTSVNIPDSVTMIDSDAFDFCKSLSSVTIGNSVTSIGSKAFQNCSGLTSINIPDSVTSIGSKAFQNCSGLTSINIPDSVTSIGDRAFIDCSSLTSVTIGSGVTMLYYWVFDGCTYIKEIYFRGINAPAFDLATSFPKVNSPFGRILIEEEKNWKYTSCYVNEPKLYYPENGVNYNINQAPYSWLYAAGIARDTKITYDCDKTTSKTVYGYGFTKIPYTPI